MTFNFKYKKSPYSCILLGKCVFCTLYEVHIYKYMDMYVYISREIQKKEPAALETMLKFSGNCVLLCSSLRNVSNKFLHTYNSLGEKRFKDYFIMCLELVP